MTPQELPVGPNIGGIDQLTAWLSVHWIVLLLIGAVLIIVLVYRYIVTYRANNPSFRSADDLDTLVEDEGETPAKP